MCNPILLKVLTLADQNHFDRLRTRQEVRKHHFYHPYVFKNRDERLGPIVSSVCES
jgi:hypothetical protein